jgi:hypothetical protein
MVLLSYDIWSACCKAHFVSCTLIGHNARVEMSPAALTLFPFLPEVPPGECVTGTMFQVTLESFGNPSVREPDGDDEIPVDGSTCVRGSPCIVLLDSATKVGG